MTFQLHRYSINGKAVYGRLYPPAAYAAVCHTLENADKIIPCGTYELQNTLSPRFKKVLPLLINVPGRAGIRIHTGTKPEHSQGCILVNEQDKQRIIELINIFTTQHDKVYIHITDCTQGTEHLPWDTAPDSAAPDSPRV